MLKSKLKQWLDAAIPRPTKIEEVSRVSLLESTLRQTQYRHIQLRRKLYEHMQKVRREMVESKNPEMVSVLRNHLAELRAILETPLDLTGS